MEVRQPLPLRNIQILLVEDEPDIADLLLFVLESAGSTVSHCTDAETALSILESCAPDLLVSNIRLSRRDGLWLIQQVRNHSCPEIRQLPAVGVTSYNREVYASHVLAAGFDRFLFKLDSPHILIETISALVAASQERSSGGCCNDS